MSFRSTVAATTHTLSVLVENQGRVNWVASNQYDVMERQSKGVVGNITFNNLVSCAYDFNY